MKKRLFKAAIFIPAAAAAVFIQLPYQIVRWIITGKEIGMPWLMEYIFFDDINQKP